MARTSPARDAEPFLVVWSLANKCYVAYLPEWRTTVPGATVEEARKSARDALKLLEAKTSDEGAGDRLIARLRGDGTAIDFRHPSDSITVARARAKIANAVSVAADPEVLALLAKRRRRSPPGRRPLSRGAAVATSSAEKVQKPPKV